MSIYLLALAAAVLFVAFSGMLVIGVVRTVRRWLAVRSAAFEVNTAVVRPGDSLRLSARVHTRRQIPIEVGATLVCTLFDHRPRRLFAQRVSLTVGAAGRWEGAVALPRSALRSGVVGDDLSSLFSEEARRWLVDWSVEFDVRDPSSRWPTLVRRRVSLSVPEGRALTVDPAQLQRVLNETVSALRDDLVVNWLVQLAARDGRIADEERAFLREVISRAQNGVSVEQADARIETERTRELRIDPLLLRRHLATQERAVLYRSLYAIAWRDGVLDPREHAFLVQSMRDLGLDRAQVAAVEREVVLGVASATLA